MSHARFVWRCVREVDATPELLAKRSIVRYTASRPSAELWAPNSMAANATRAARSAAPRTKSKPTKRICGIFARTIVWRCLNWTRKWNWQRAQFVTLNSTVVPTKWQRWHIFPTKRWFSALKFACVITWRMIRDKVLAMNAVCRVDIMAWYDRCRRIQTRERGVRWNVLNGIWSQRKHLASGIRTSNRSTKS